MKDSISTGGGWGRKCTSETIRGRAQLEDPWELFEGVSGVGERRREGCGFELGGSSQLLPESHPVSGPRAGGEERLGQRGSLLCIRTDLSRGHEALRVCQTAGASPDRAPRGL